MVIKKIEFEKFDIHRLYEATDKVFFATVNSDGRSSSYIYEEYPKDKIIDMLNSGCGVFYSFAIRDGKNLECANGQLYVIREDIDEVGLDMGDAYIGEEECMNLGFLVSCDDNILTFKVSLEGEAGMFTRCVVVKDCGDLEDDMKGFLKQFEL